MRLNHKRVKFFNNIDLYLDISSEICKIESSQHSNMAALIHYITAGLMDDKIKIKIT